MRDYDTESEIAWRVFRCCVFGKKELVFRNHEEKQGSVAEAAIRCFTGSSSKAQSHHINNSEDVLRDVVRGGDRHPFVALHGSHDGHKQCSTRFAALFVFSFPLIRRWVV